MKVWQWFCQLGTYKIRLGLCKSFRTPAEALVVQSRESYTFHLDKKADLVFGRVRYKENIAAPCKTGPSGVESVCTRLSGNAGCQCGSTMRGLHCIWSYYRMN
ncbi:hypothetical protein SPSIL_006490 [Sporomusa silvacetica DSM 10669]|uniref:Uncharacterized protein n=1 Tax=Sporomusa silvacetica DSM 10669 TaxID=1123289 RepID=A0ABZ3IFT2_9FIRM|nr:hypothetical protein [Sporomusa silvacetica]OZC17025.1 hypothetical protein SPSIL_33900 [Sporomusa silvacetica DSM 10669]